MISKNTRQILFHSKQRSDGCWVKRRISRYCISLIAFGNNNDQPFIDLQYHNELRRTIEQEMVIARKLNLLL
jgi:hypothetical protein